jgi:Big-like domain-containing protein
MPRIPASRHISFLLVGAVLAATSGCRNDVGPDAEEEAQLRVTASVAGIPVDRIVATVAAADIPTSLVFNLPITDGTATGTLRIPPGDARSVTLQAFDPSGAISHEGSATIDVRAGPNPPVTIIMLPRSGDVPITATIGSVSVVLSPGSATLEVGESRQFHAEVRGADNLPVDADVEWAVTNPAFATVDQSGTVTALAEGSLTLVATYAGVAGTASLTMGAGNAPAPVTVAEARALADGSGVVVGEATLTAVFSGGNTTLWMQDATGGIRVFLSGTGVALTIGQHVRVSGTRSTPGSGDVSITASTVEVLSNGPAAAPLATGGAGLLDGSLQGRLVVVSGGVVQGFTAESQPKPIVQVAGSTYVLDTQAAGLPSSGFVLGQTLTSVTGVLGLHTTGVRLIARSIADVVT